MEELQKAADLIETTVKNGGKILVCGNGGSCADGDHIVGELMKGKKILFNTSIGPGFDSNALKNWLQDENHFFFGDTLLTAGDTTIWSLPNTFTINRSSGGKTYQAFLRLGEKVINNIKNYFE